jgi:cytoskeletal protein CcmA (bactofilin family)
MLGKRSKAKTVARIDTLIGQHSEIRGDIAFSGGLHVDGTIRGDVSAPDDSGSVLTLSEHGAIEGEVRVPHIILNGSVVGDVHAAERIELAARARVTGNVYYNLIEMAMGAEVNGSLVHRSEVTPTAGDTVPVLNSGTEGEPESVS